jgi:hypothetical protein
MDANASKEKNSLSARVYFKLDHQKKNLKLLGICNCESMIETINAN